MKTSGLWCSRMDSNGRLTRPQRRGVVLVTLLFICASAALHMIFGGIVHPPAWKEAPEPSVTTIWVGQLLHTPPPTPTPRPQPSPTPQPRDRVAPSPQAIATRVIKPAAPPLPPVTLPSSEATGGSGTFEQSPGPVSDVSPAASAPPDYRYIVVSARFIHRVQPAYPDEAMRAGEEGTVIVTLTIGPSGVSDVRIWESSGYADLDREALRAAKESTYSIPEVNGEPATETYRVIYTFSINS
jgi:protein TonB